MHYSPLERRIAKELDSLPTLRNYIKRIYQLVNYLFTRKNGVRVSLNPGVVVRPVLVTQGTAGSIFFGYYDKSPWSPCGKYYLVHLHSAERSDIVQLGYYDLEEGCLGIFAESRAWNFQQGSMLQWLPADGQKVIFNDVVRGALVARMVDPLSGTDLGFFEVPVQAMSPDGKTALSLNYKRLYNLRPEYGYAPDVTNFSPEMDPARDGIWRVDVSSGTVTMVLSLEKLMAFQPRKEMDGAAHKVNHILFSPTGERFAFMHRWIGPNGKFSRLYTANPDGSGLCLLGDDRMVSHYSWKNPSQLLAWARKEPYGDHYFLFDDRSEIFRIIGEGILDRFGDGHPSFSQDGRWIVTDTYPDKTRMRSLMLYDTHYERLFEVGRFFAPWRYDGPQRCDLHPRWHPSGKMISIDSIHEGVRGSYVIDVVTIVGDENA